MVFGPTVQVGSGCHWASVDQGSMWVKLPVIETLVESWWTRMCGTFPRTLAGVTAMSPRMMLSRMGQIAGLSPCDAEPIAVQDGVAVDHYVLEEGVDADGPRCARSC
jgi:hypothetical protein